MVWIVAVLRYSKYFDTALKYFPIIIAYTFLTELLGYLIYNYEFFQLISKEGFSYYNVIIYNIYDIFFFSYFYYLYWTLVSKKNFKQWIMYAGFLYILATLINPFFQDPMIQMQIYAYTIGACILILCCILHLTTIYKQDGTYKRHRNIMLWIDLGLLIFHLGYLPIALINNNYTVEKFQEYIHLRTIHLSLIVIMYSFFIIGFVTMRKKALK